MSKAPPATVRVCAECGADNAPAANKCWVCNGKLENATDVIIAELMAEPEAKSRYWPAWIAAVGVLAVSGAAIVGVFAHSPGFGVLFAIVWAVALIGLLLSRPVVRTSLSQPAVQKPPVANPYAATSAVESSGQASGYIPRVTTGWEIARQVILTLAIVGLVMVGIVVALFVLCFAIIAMDSPGSPFR